MTDKNQEKNLSEQLMGPLCGDFKPSQQVDYVTHRLTNQSLYLNQQYINSRSVISILNLQLFAVFNISQSFKNLNFSVF